jgi:hypothetical protein
MDRFALSLYLEAEPGVATPLVPAGSALENPYVYDSVARELKELARQGKVQVLSEELVGDLSEPLIGSFAFKRLR